MGFTTTIVLLLTAMATNVIDVTSGSFTRSCREFRFKNGGRSIIAKCGIGRWGREICSELDFSLCFANEDGKIVNRNNGGFKNVEYCNLDDRTGEGSCLAYNNVGKLEWNEFNPDMGIANTIGQLTCFDHAAPPYHALTCQRRWETDTWAKEGDDQDDGKNASPSKPPAAACVREEEKPEASE